MSIFSFSAQILPRKKKKEKQKSSDYYGFGKSEARVDGRIVHNEELRKRDRSV